MTQRGQNSHGSEITGRYDIGLEDIVDPRLRCSLDNSHTTDTSFDLLVAAVAVVAVAVVAAVVVAVVAVVVVVDTAFQNTHGQTNLFPDSFQDIHHRLEHT